MQERAIKPSIRGVTQWENMNDAQFIFSEYTALLKDTRQLHQPKRGTKARLSSRLCSSFLDRIFMSNLTQFETLLSTGSSSSR